MKKISLTLILTLLFFGTQAQEETIANQFVLGGSLNFVSQKNSVPLVGLPVGGNFGVIFSDNLNDTKNTVFSFSPYFGKEINANWLFGLQLDYRLNNYTAEDAFNFSGGDPIDFNRKSNNFGFGLFGRYTLNPAQRFQFYLQPFAGYNLLSENTKNNDILVQEQTANHFEAGVGLGILYNINSKFRATLRTGGLNYINGKWKVKDTPIDKGFSSFGLNLNLTSVFIGVEMKL